MEINFRLDNGIFKPAQLLSDDRMYADAAYARDGILTYKMPDGRIRKELRLPETNMDGETLASYAGSTLTIEHPPELINGMNRNLYSAGISDREVVYDNGFIRGVVLVNRSDAIEAVRNKLKPEISAGYFCDSKNEPGVWRGERYDAVQQKVRVNHIALTAKGRAGPDVKIRIDSHDGIGDLLQYAYQVDDDIFDNAPIYFTQRSQSSQPKKEHLQNQDSEMTDTQAVVRLDNMNWDSLEQFAQYVQPKLEAGYAAELRADAVEAELEENTLFLDSMTDSLEELNDVVELYKTDAEEAKGEAQAYQIMLDNAEILLSKFGYRPDGYGNYVRSDGGDYEEDMDDMPEGMPEEMMKHMGKKKKKGMKKDSVEELLVAWDEARQLVPGIQMDSDLDVVGVRRLVIDHIDPQDDMDDADVNGYYKALTRNSAMPKFDSAQFNADNQLEAIQASRQLSSQKQKPAVSDISDAWNQPLALTRSH